MVTPGNVTADIGCDHAHTGIFLVQKGISPRVIAMDLRPGPLDKARENVASEGVSDKVVLRLSDGLDAFTPGEADTILISGMGGPLILSILERNPDKALSASELILSPQSDVEEFSEGIKKLGFSITETRIVEEADKYYFVFRAVKGDGTEYLNDVTPHDVWLGFLEKELANDRKIIGKLEADDGEKAAVRREELYERNRRIQDEINRLRN